MVGKEVAQILGNGQFRQLLKGDGLNLEIARMIATINLGMVFICTQHLDFLAVTGSQWKPTNLPKISP